MEELGMIEHQFRADDVEPDPGLNYRKPAPIRRSLVAGQTLFTLSGAGLKGSDLASLSEISWTSFRTNVPRPLFEVDRDWSVRGRSSG